MKNHDGITQIVGRLSNKIYIVESGDELVVVDPGMPSDHRRLFERIRSLGRSPTRITV
jgi:glyoxylase-like metal-dependent hydrolase (beta-lactamase superfamily II)